MESVSVSRALEAVDDDRVGAEALRDLRQRRADLVVHGGRSLEDHLRGTYDVLTAWRQPSRVCLAGLLHSGYSTDAFEHCLYQIDDRSHIQALIGEEAEHLVYLFCAIHRQNLFDACRLSGEFATPLRLVNRWGGADLAITRREAGDLLVLHMANAAEQSCLSGGAPARWLVHVSELGRWAKSLADVVPPVFDGCTEIVSAESEDRLHEAYDDLLRSVAANRAGKMESLPAGVAGSAWVAEPLIWLGILSLAAGDTGKAAYLGARARLLLGAWGTPWDKRLTLEKWQTLVTLLIETAERGDEGLSPASELVRTALSLSGKSGAGLPPPSAEMAQPRTSPANLPNGVLPPRFEEYVASFDSNQGLPRHDNLYPRIATKPWFDAQQFPLARDLERAAPRIIDEFQKLDTRLFRDEAENIPREGHWSVLFLHDRTGKKNEIRDLCPVTASVIDAHTDVTALAGVCYFSCLEPGTRVAPHRGPTNMRLRCHLGIEVPDRCGLKVCGIEGTWEEGRCIVFDDSFEHEVWNLSDRRRVVLIVDLWHPDLTGDEVTLLKWVAA
jgi:hypothetical protein